LQYERSSAEKLNPALKIVYRKKEIGSFGVVNSATLGKFDIRQPVYFIDLDWQEMLIYIKAATSKVDELPKQLPVHRDLAMVVEKSLPYGEVERSIHTIGLKKLKQVQLFDVFESDKLGENKKSLAVSFTFLDEEKTLTDKEIDGMMNKIIQSLEKDVQAQIRSN